MYLYPLVEVAGQMTPLRVVSPLRVLVHAPPATWGWQGNGTPHPDAPQAKPVLQRGHDTPTWFVYNQAESEVLWFASESYQGSPPVL